MPNLFRLNLNLPNGLTPSSDDRLWLMLCLAITIHSVALLGIHFTHEQIQQSETLEITLVTHRSTKPPQDPDFLAQAPQEGSGSLKEKAEVSTTQLADFNANEIHEIQPIESGAQPTRENQTRAVISTKSAHSQTTTPPTPFLAPAPDEDHRETTPGDPSIERRALEIASLQAQLKNKQQAYAKRPRKEQLTAISAKEDRSAAYLDAWRNQIETTGNNNYPALNINNLYGSLRLMVSINASGHLVEIKLLKSSGHPRLDQAAIQVVRQAAPFAPFPESIRQTTDILEIIRTWKFEEGHYSL